MNRMLLDHVVGEIDQPQVDSEYIIDSFVDVCIDYLEETTDPTTDQIEVLLVHFADRDPDDLDEETLSLLWVMRAIMQWMVDDLPLQKEYSDPEWLRKKLEYWESIGYEGPSYDSGDDPHSIEGRLKVLIEILAQNNEAGAPMEDILDRVSDIGIEPAEAEDILMSLMQRGEVWETEQDHLETDY
ncbi:hypothetical protein [Halonotius sp. GCM10025705]|uniref:hypothetical protein n=1 Tax=Halonotius sp. GCM10025705 TaxID=3252678 RepID=UPI0036D337AC